MLTSDQKYLLRKRSLPHPPGLLRGIRRGTKGYQRTLEIYERVSEGKEVASSLLQYLRLS